MYPDEMLDCFRPATIRSEESAGNCRPCNDVIDDAVRLPGMMTHIWDTISVEHIEYSRYRGLEHMTQSVGLICVAARRVPHNRNSEDRQS
jgi:hypothetical protein